MQSQISPPQAMAYDAIDNLLDVVETKMMESISVNAVRVSSPPTSAMNAAAYHLGVGGQRVRAKLALQAGVALGLSTTDAVCIATAVELLHNASLVHDDIQDRDELRRGQPAVWVRFGVNTAVCAGDLLLSAAYAALCRLENSQSLPAMVTLVHQRIAMAIDGQCADLMASKDAPNNAVLDITRYKHIAIAKSGALLSLPIELVLLAAGRSEYLPDAQHAAEAFAVSYQIVDDLDDEQSDAGLDCANGLGGALNIISVLKAAGYADDCAEKAKLLGLQHLDVAVDLAGRLPCHAGALLIDYTYRFRKLLSAQY